MQQYKENYYFYHDSHRYDHSNNINNNDSPLYDEDNAGTDTYTGIEKIIEDSHRSMYQVQDQVIRIFDNNDGTIFIKQQFKDEYYSKYNNNLSIDDRCWYSTTTTNGKKLLFQSKYQVIMYRVNTTRSTIVLLLLHSGSVHNNKDDNSAIIKQIVTLLQVKYKMMPFVHEENDDNIANVHDDRVGHIIIGIIDRDTSTDGEILLLRLRYRVRVQVQIKYGVHNIDSILIHPVDFIKNNGNFYASINGEKYTSQSKYKVDYSTNNNNKKKKKKKETDDLENSKKSYDNRHPTDLATSPADTITDVDEKDNYDADTISVLVPRDDEILNDDDDDSTLYDNDRYGYSITSIDGEKLLFQSMTRLERSDDNKICPFHLMYDNENDGDTASTVDDGEAVLVYNTFISLLFRSAHRVDRMYRAILLLLKSESVYDDKGYTIAVEYSNRNLYFNYLLDENSTILYDDIKRNIYNNNDEGKDTSNDNNDDNIQVVLYKEEDVNNDNNDDVQKALFQEHNDQRNCIVTEDQIDSNIATITILVIYQDVYNNDNDNDVQLVVYPAKYKMIRPIAIDNPIATMQLVALHQDVHEDNVTIAVLQPSSSASNCSKQRQQG